MHIETKVTSGAKKEMIKKISSTSFKISVKEKAQRNAANKRVRELLADYFSVSLGSVQILSGHHSSKKVLDIMY